MKSPQTPTPLIPYKVPTYTLTARNLERVPLDNVEVFRFPNSRGLVVVYNARGDAQITSLAWSSYRLTDVQPQDTVTVTTHAQAEAALLQRMAVEMSKPDELASKHYKLQLDIAALAQVGLEERHVSYSYAYDDGLTPEDPSPSLDWAEASLASLPQSTQDTILEMLRTDANRLIIYNGLANIHSIAIRKAIEAQRIEEATYLLRHKHIGGSILHYQDFLLAAANQDLQGNSQHTRAVIEAIASRQNGIALPDMLQYFAKSEQQHTDVRFIQHVLKAAIAEGVTVRDTLTFDAETGTYTDCDSYWRRSDRETLLKGYQRYLSDMYKPQKTKELSPAVVNMTDVVNQLQKGYGKQGPEVPEPVETDATLTKEQATWARLGTQIAQLRGSIGHYLAIREEDTSLTLVDHFNDLGLVTDAAPPETIGALNHFMVDLLKSAALTDTQKVEWFIDCAIPVLMDAKKKHGVVEAALGALPSWSDELVADVKAQLQQRRPDTGLAADTQPRLY